MSLQTPAVDVGRRAARRERGETSDAAVTVTKEAAIVMDKQ